MVTSSGSDAHLSRAHALVDEREHDSVEQVRRWLRIPSFSDTGEGIAACAEYTRDLLGLVCPDATVTATAGNPVVWGATGPAEPGVPTLLVYGLYDVTPTLAHEWTVDPLAAEIVPAESWACSPRWGTCWSAAARTTTRARCSRRSGVRAPARSVRRCLPASCSSSRRGGDRQPQPRRLRGGSPRAIGPVAGTWLPCMNQSSTGVMSMRRAYKGSLFAWLECRGGEWGGTRDAATSGQVTRVDRRPMMKLSRRWHRSSTSTSG
jgi:hypothetical protein